MILRIAIFFSLCVLLLVYSSIAFSAEWKLVDVYITRDPTKFDNYHFIDLKGAKRIGNKVRYWRALKSVPHGSSLPSNDEVSKNAYMEYFEMDCSRKRYRDVTTEQEDRPGYVTVYPTIRWDNIRPDSTEEKIFNVLCKRK